ncbi:hypothetical protein Tco_1293284 [Tanacetum coccineum]
MSILSKDIGLKDDKHISPCDICHKAKQTRDPFPLSDHKSESVDASVLGYLMKPKDEVAFYIESFVELIRPFEILGRIGPVAYRLRLPEELSGVHDTFHVSNLKKCLADASLHVPLGEIKVNKTLRFVEEPVEIMDREVKSLKRSKIVLVKVRLNSKRGPEFTWEREDYMKSKYPQLFVDRADESANYPLSVCEAFVGFFWEAKHQVSFMRILRLREVARATARIALEFTPEFIYVYCMDFVECYLILLGS